MGIKKTLATLVLTGFTSLVYSQTALIPSNNASLQSTLTTNSLDKKNSSITVIDPGHDNHWKPQKYLGVAEHENTLAISKIAEQQIIKNGRIVKLTRYDDSPLGQSRYKGSKLRTKELQLRSNIATKLHANLLVSVHTNFAEKWVRGRKRVDTTRTGMEVYFFGYPSSRYIGNGRIDYFRPEHAKYGSKKSKQRALHFAYFLEQKTGKPVKVRASDMTVLNQRGNWKELQRERLLWEVGFESNPTERKFIRNNSEYFGKLLAEYVLEHVPQMKPLEMKQIIQKEIVPKEEICNPELLTQEVYRSIKLKQNYKISSGLKNINQVNSSDLEVKPVQIMYTRHFSDAEINNARELITQNKKNKKGFFNKLFRRN